MEARFVPLAEAAPDEVVVVIDVLRAFTVQPLLLAGGVSRLLTVADVATARQLRDERFPDALLAGEDGGESPPGFDLGNSPSEVAGTPLEGRTVLHRTSAGTQGLSRTTGSGAVLAASFTTAGATARFLQAASVRRVTFVITGASLGRDGDEDLAAAELIAARARGEDPDPAAFLARVARSDHGRFFGEDGPAWADPRDLAAALELDRHPRAVLVDPYAGPEVLEARWAMY